MDDVAQLLALIELAPVTAVRLPERVKLPAVTPAADDLGGVAAWLPGSAEKSNVTSVPVPFEAHAELEPESTDGVLPASGSATLASSLFELGGGWNAASLCGACAAASPVSGTLSGSMPTAHAVSSALAMKTLRASWRMTGAPCLIAKAPATRKMCRFCARSVRLQ